MSSEKIEAKASTNGSASKKSAAAKTTRKPAATSKTAKGSTAKKKLVPGSIEAVLRAIEYAKKHPAY